MRKIFIVCGHGNYGTGLQSSIELLLGQDSDLKYIDFLVSDSDIIFKEKILKVINNNVDSQVLFICDILGGTPYKVVAELSNNNDNMEVIAGVNIGSIIEGSFQKENLSINELAYFIVNSSKNSTVKFEKVTEGSIFNEATDEGI